MPRNYTAGTDLRNEDGYYAIPDSVPVPDGFERRPLVSVTTCLDLVTDLRFPDRWWTAEYVLQLAEATKAKQQVRIWHPKRKEMVEVLAGQVLLNSLPEDFGTNYGMHWIKNAGARELERRGNRGQIMHDAVADWVLHDMRVRPSELPDYVGQLIEGRGYAITAEYCMYAVAGALAWCDAHVNEPYMCETCVVNWTYGHAGTVDLGSTLRALDGVNPDDRCQVDFKSSADAYFEHKLQAAAYQNMESVILREYEDGMASCHPYPRPHHLLNVYANSKAAKPARTLRWDSPGDEYCQNGLDIQGAYAAFLHTQMMFHYNARTQANSPQRVGVARPPTAEHMEAMRTGAQPQLVVV